MKIEQLIVQHLYNNKKVSLQNIGIFYLSPNVTIPFENDKDSFMPEKAITFEYNTRAVQDDDLIAFIVKQTRKIKPLATSDLESFTILGRQFMNIGKPLPIEGLGILQKNQVGQYEFIQGNSINAKLEPAPALLREKDKGEIVFTTPARKRNSKMPLIAVVILLVLLSALTVFYFLFKTNKNVQSETPLPPAVNPAALNTAKPPDTTQKATPALQDTFNPAVVNGQYTFKVVIREYPDKALADKAFARFTTLGHTVIIYPKDANGYKMAVPFNTPLSDTLHAKDSLYRKFLGRPYIEIR